MEHEAPPPVLECAQSRVVYASQSLAALLGYSVQALTGLTLPAMLQQPYRQMHGRRCVGACSAYLPCTVWHGCALGTQAWRRCSSHTAGCTDAGELGRGHYAGTCMPQGVQWGRRDMYAIIIEWGSMYAIIIEWGSMYAIGIQ